MQQASHTLLQEKLFAHMMFECVCQQVSIVGGDANKMAYQKAGQQLNGSYSMSTCQFWVDRMEQTLDYYMKNVLKNNKDMNVRQFHSMSYLDLKYLRETIEGKVDLDPAVRKETERIGDCCMLTFFEYGLSTPVETFSDGNNNANLEYKYSVNELLFYLANDIMMLRKKDAGSHCPILATIEPSDMMNQEKKNFQTEDLKKQRAATREEIQKANKAKGKARATT